MYIGVVGGVGPIAGLDIHRLLLKSAIVEKDQDYYPIIISSIPHEIADRSDYLLGVNSENPGFAIKNQIVKLYHAGCRVIGVACNTAHSKIIWEVIENGVKQFDDLVLINMIEETFRSLANESEQVKVLLLATKGTYHANTFRDYAMKFNVNLVYPSAENQLILHNIIYEKKNGIKSKGVLRGKNRKSLNGLIKAELENNFAIKGVILGCTELSYVSDCLKIENCLVHNTNSILASSLIEKFITIKHQDY
jgi:aspartate racemase